MSEPRHLAAAEGHLLVELWDHRICEVLDDKLVEVPNAAPWAQADW
jgi:hypothetical protein